MYSEVTINKPYNGHYIYKTKQSEKKKFSVLKLYLLVKLMRQYTMRYPAYEVSWSAGYTIYRQLLDNQI